MTLAPIDAIILCGGRGTRLATVVSDVPKPLAAVSGRPFLDPVLDHLAASGLISRVVLAVGYLGEKIVAHYTQNPPTLPVSFVHELTPLGTGGALINALPTTTSDPVLALNGDSFFRFDVARMLQHQIERGADATLGLVSVPDCGRYGRVTLDGTRVTAFHEKRPGNEPGLINGGVMMLSRRLLAGPVRALSAETELLPQAIARGAVEGLAFNGPFLDIGLPESFAEAPSFLRGLQR